MPPIRRHYISRYDKGLNHPEPISVKHFSNPFKFGIDELNKLITHEIHRYDWDNGFYDWDLWTLDTIEALRVLRISFKKALKTKSLKQGIEIASDALYIYAAVVYTESLRIYNEDSQWIREKEIVCETAYFTKRPPRKDRKFSNEEDYIFERWMTWCWKDGESGHKDWWTFLRPDDSDLTLPPPSTRKRRNGKEDANTTTQRLVATAEQNRVNNRQRTLHRYHYLYTVYVR